MVRRNELSPVAVVDIGSNSVRLVVYEGATRAPTPLFNEKVLCGLGRSIASTGRLGADALARALRALRRFRALIDQMGVTRVEAIATAAAREAENGPDFIAQAERMIEVPIRVLSGTKEAELAAVGVIAGIHDADGFVGDLGGGSLELIDVRKVRLGSAATLPLGGLRLIDASGSNLKKAREIVDAELAKVDWLEKGNNRDFYAIGGTWRALARLHMTQTNYPLNIMHNYRIEAADALKFASLLDQQSQSSLAGIRDISGARRETIPYGSLVLERLLRQAKPRAVVISVFGIREGLLCTMLSEDERRKDPLLAACDDLARRRSRSIDSAYELCFWTDALFRAPGPVETPEQRRLRHASCLLSDIGWHAHPDYRGARQFRRRRSPGPGVPRAYHLLPQRRHDQGRAKPKSHRACRQGYAEARPHSWRCVPRRPHGLGLDAGRAHEHADQLRRQPAGLDLARALFQSRRGEGRPQIQGARGSARPGRGNPRRPFLPARGELSLNLLDEAAFPKSLCYEGRRQPLASLQPTVRHQR
jgi:exopolyphosphatase / guanosine-5'-triphosphate,3'-diphosphate pyrophosphatase